ncbi:protein involved in polysaccharide export, contains SLBB domain of the beta-grasp fold [Reichenbachiella agariperforans]|uniref:Protein involved in polysaccharide export, contains SLBB domain of the beta-grasp fold n=1 Tax=Reichenbachiella agariperforans TaxID=156994 RepID=A0A1M6NVB6_REIAG|nr:protein involved in polysaccharide export, contains SLBB domain of the beta-grasp fold [Reichenbachiella agariperforans]
MRHIACMLLVTTVLFLSNETLAQSPSLQNISSVNVDDLSDEQIKQFIGKAESSGYSEDQLMMMAKTRGMSELQIQKLRKRVSDLKSGSNNSQTANIDRLRDTNQSQGSQENGGAFDPFDVVKYQKPDSIDGLTIFGQSFFENSSLSFETGLNMPTPANYVIGPGDEVIIDIWGASEKTYQVVVSPEGAIRIPNLGPIYITGLTMDKAKVKIISRLKRIYSTIGRSSNADVTLGQIRSINVHVIGQVKKPGTFTLSSFGTAFNALYSAGGPSKDGSLRQIEVYRAKELISTLDAYEFMIRGTGENITLQDQDVIIVRPYISRVKFTGEVKNPAVYELTKGETFEDLLFYSGGLTNMAYQGVVSLRRIDKNFKTVRSLEIDKAGEFELYNGDEIEVGKITNEFINRVTIEGPVMNPGEYQLEEGMTLLTLIELADGVRGDTFMERGVIIRQNEDFSLANISFNPRKLLNGEESVVLQSNDVIKLQSIYDLRERYNLMIEGEVQKPGEFVYVDGMKVKDLIFLAGGFKESAAKSFVEVARRIDPDSTTDKNSSAEIFNFPISEKLDISEKDSKFELEPFDLVVIRKSPFYIKQETVEIEGEVEFPGKYVIERKDERISSILKRAGGVSDYSYVEGATLIRKSEYYKKNVSDPGYANDAIRVRKQDLTEIFKRDTLFTNEAVVFKQEEAIGIQLDKIMADPGSKYDLILKKGDIISIPRQLQTVRVRGSVLYPSNIRFNKGSGFKKYVGLAGGFDQRAKKSKSYVIYANGSAAQTSSFLWIKNYPKIEPGAEIVIPQKPNKTPMSAQGWIALSSGVATLALVITQIINNAK